MNQKSLLISFLLVSLVGFGVGYILTNSYDWKICLANIETNTFDVSCHISYENIGNPLFYGMGALATVFILLLFIPQAFVAWKKFAVWFVPLATLLFIFYPDPGSGDFFSPYPEQIFQWISGFYILASIAIIAIASLRKTIRSQT